MSVSGCQEKMLCNMVIGLFGDHRGLFHLGLVAGIYGILGFRLCDRR